MSSLSPIDCFQYRLLMELLLLMSANYLERAQKLRGITLRSSIIQNQLSDIGKIKLVIREININADRKRLWLGRAQTVDAQVCNDSMAISLNCFGKNEI